MYKYFYMFHLCFKTTTTNSFEIIILSEKRDVNQRNLISIRKVTIFATL